MFAQDIPQEAETTRLFVQLLVLFHTYIEHGGQGHSSLVSLSPPIIFLVYHQLMVALRRGVRGFV